MTNDSKKILIVYKNVKKYKDLVKYMYNAKMNNYLFLNAKEKYFTDTKSIDAFVMTYKPNIVINLENFLLKSFIEVSQKYNFSLVCTHSELDDLIINSLSNYLLLDEPLITSGEGFLQLIYSKIK